MSGFDNAIDAGDASTDSGFDLHELIEIDDSTDDDVVECHPRPVAPPEDDEERSVAETCNSIEAKGHDKEADEVADEGEVADDDEHDTKSKDRVEMAQQPCVDVVASSDESKPEDEQDTKDEVSKVAEPVAVAKKSPKSPKKKKDIASEEEKKPNNTARCGGRGRGRGRGSPRGGRGGSTKDARHSSSSSPSQTEDVSTTAPDTTDSQKSPTRGLGAAKTRATRSPRGKSSPSATILAPATPPSSVSSLSAFGDTFTPPHTPDSSNSSLGSVSTEEYFSAKTPPSPPTPLPLTPPKTPKRKRKVSATSANVEVVIESSPGTEGESPAKKKRVYKPRVKKVPAVAEADTKAAAATPAGAIPAAVVSTVPVHVEDAPAISEAEEDPDIEASQPSEASQSQPSLGSPTKVTKKAKSNKPKGHWTAEEMMQLFTHVYRRDWSPDWEVVARSSKLDDLNKTLEAYLGRSAILSWKDGSIDKVHVAPRFYLSDGFDGEDSLGDTRVSCFDKDMLMREEWIVHRRETFLCR